jgi:predicted ArsR family transcriptional regulator
MSDRESLARLASLAEPVRTALYEWVCDQTDAVTREQAAAAVGVAHHVAKFNLDRLVDDGFLDADYRRPPGRGGPGAGRPAKVYRRSRREFDVSVPPRQYDLAAGVLANAVEACRSSGGAIDAAVHDAAYRAGQRMAQATTTRSRSSLRRVADVVRDNGYEPCVERSCVRLRNCPFHALRREQTELVCGMNLSLLEGVLDGLDVRDAVATLEPHEGDCCVRITTR